MKKFIAAAFLIATTAFAGDPAAAAEPEAPSTEAVAEDTMGADEAKPEGSGDEAKAEAKPAKKKAKKASKAKASADTK